MKAALLLIGTVMALMAGVYPIAYHLDEPMKVITWTAWSEYSPYVAAATLLLVILVFRKALRTPAFLFAAASCGVALAVPLLSLPYPSSLQTTSPALQIRVPMTGPVKVAWGGDSTSENYHAAYPDQRWAYDLVIAPYGSQSQDLEDYGCFGRDVLAPVAGRVVTAHDGQPDIPPTDDPDVGPNVFGNYIVIDPGIEDTRLVIAHLRNGSLAVSENDQVSEYQKIAQCGNSGNSTEPHVHIHYLKIHRQGENAHLTGLPLYFRNHQGEAMPGGGIVTRQGHEEMVGATIQDKG